MSNSDIFNFAIRLVQAYSPQTVEGIKKLVPQVGQLQGVAPESQQPTREQFDRMRHQALTEVKELDGSVTVIIGGRGLGKTVLEYRIAEFFGRPTYAVSPEEKPPSWVIPITLEDLLDETKVPVKSTLVCDDLPAYASNRDYNDTLVQGLEKIIPMVRHKRKLHLIFGTQTSAQADKYVGDCELGFLKPLGLFVEERPRVRQIYKEFGVEKVFEGQSLDWVKRHAVMISRTYKGVVEIAEAKK